MTPEEAERKHLSAKEKMEQFDMLPPRIRAAIADSIGGVRDLSSLVTACEIYGEEMALSIIKRADQKSRERHYALLEQMTEVIEANSLLRDLGL